MESYNPLVIKMKAVAFNCSPRENGNTAAMIKDLFKVLEAEGIETELIQVGGHDLHGCRGCGVCRKKKDMHCIFEDDIINSCINKIVDADAVIIGSPTYFGDVTTEAKAFIDRVGYVLRSNGNPVKRKVGTGVVAVRRCGSMHALHTINNFFTINEMIVVSSSYWNMSLARMPGDFDNDEEGKETIQTLGENMAWLMKKLE